MRVLWRIADFARTLQRELRFGDLSRAPVQLLRMEWRQESVACDWLARPADLWDQDLRRQVREANEAEQALRDAIAIRQLVFDALPGLKTAALRAFRPASGGAHDLIIVGAANRGDFIPRKVSSTAMRAKLAGFQFWLQDGALEAMPSEECAMSF